MANSSMLDLIYVRNLNSAKILGRLRSCLLPACFYIVLLCGNPAEAVIATSGSVVPPVPIGDPWNVGGPLYIAYSGPGAMVVTNDRDVSNTDGWIGLTGVGSVGIQNSGSSWENTGNLNLGNVVTGGVGYLTVSDGGTVFVGDAAKVSDWSSSSLYVSDTDSSGTSGGQLYIRNGSRLTSHHSANVGDDAGEYGWATVEGAGSTWTVDDYLIVGLYGSGTLSVRNSGSVSSKVGEIGYLTRTSTGMATIDGPGSTWNIESFFVIGSSGSGTLNIQNGGSVSSNNSGIGSSGTGTVTVAGPGSTWTNESYLDVGSSGSGTLNILDGGSVSNASGDIAWNEGSIGTVMVDGDNSLWTNHGDLHVGINGSGTLTIQNGGSVSSEDGSIGHQIGTDIATVDGTGSTWTNNGNLFVRSSSGSATLEIINGGSVSSISSMIGHNNYHGGTGTVTIDGAGSNLECNDNLSLGSSEFSGVGSLNISNDGAVYVGDAAKSGGVSSWLTVSDTDSSGSAGGQLSVYNGSTLTHGSSAILGDDAGEYGWATVDGSGSSWTNSGWLYVGNKGTGTLTVQNGGSVSNTNGRLGYDTGSTGTVVVDGTGSSWECTDNLWLGRSSNSGVGSLDIANDGTVWIGDAAKNSGGAGFLIISDDDSGTSDGRMYIYNGSTVTNDSSAYLGYHAGEYGRATVDGIDSTWNNSEYLFVGLYGTGAVTIQNGGSASSKNGAIASMPDSSGTVIVNGTDSSWANSVCLYAGDEGSGTLTIQNGGSVSSTAGKLGNIAGSTGMVTVDGPGSSWINSSSLYVGNGSSGTLTIQNGGSVESYQSMMGKYAGSSGTATVDGADSSWTNSVSLTVGNSGSGTLSIQNGGSVSSPIGIVGDGSTGTGTVTVDGAGSSWECTHSLSLGRSYESGVGSLNICNGGTVFIGNVASSNGPAGWLSVSETDSSGLGGGQLYIYGGSTLAHGGNAVLGYGGGEYGWATVAGAGSTWSNNNHLYVGYNGSGTLTVQDGGRVSCAHGRLGYETGGSGTVAVEGAGSIWENTGNLWLGSYHDSGAGSLIVSDAGTVWVGDAAKSGGTTVALNVSDTDSSGFSGGRLYIYNGSTLNHDSPAVVGRGDGEYGWATIGGSGSSWKNTLGLTIGENGSAMLEIRNGGSVSNTGGWIAYDSQGSGAVTVDGEGSTWTNSGDLFAGREGPGVLTISDNGLVSVAGTLTIDMNTDGDSFINMKTGGKLALWGEADESLRDFLGLVDGSDAINYWDEFISDWSPILDAMYCRDYTLNYLTKGDLDGYTLLRVRRAIDGDANGDGVVDVTDLGILATHYGMQNRAEWCNGDFNGDGAVDVSDLGVLASHYGETAAASVPEPSMFAGLLLLFLAGLLRQSRRRG